MLASKNKKLKSSNRSNCYRKIYDYAKRQDCFIILEYYILCILENIDETNTDFFRR